MNETIELLDPYEPLSPDDVVDLEAFLEVELPDDYKDFLLSSNGASFENVTCGNLPISYLLGCKTHDTFDVFYWHESPRHGPRSHWPAFRIGAGLYGSFFLSCSRDHAGTVFHIYEPEYESGTRIQVVASSFVGFLASLAPDPEWKSGEELPLFRAIDEGLLSEVKLLVEAGVSANSRNIRGWTALMRAALSRRHRIAQYLIKTGRADCSLRDPDGWSALRYAVASHSPQLTELLMDAGGNPNERNYQGRHLLEEAVAVSSAIRVLRYLILHGSDTCQCRSSGSTFLAWVEEMQGKDHIYTDRVRALLDQLEKAS